MRIIAADNLQVNHEHHKVFGREIRERLDFNNGAQNIQYERHERQLFASREHMQFSHSDEPVFSEAALKRFADSISSTPGAGKQADAVFDFGISGEELEKLRMLLSALARWSGDFDLYQSMFTRISERQDLTALRPNESSPPRPQNTTALAQNQSAAVPSLSYDYHVTQWQHEQLKVNNSGSVTTADGRTIDFNLTVDMQYTHASSESVSMRIGGQLKDPLVINYAGSSAQLTQQRMQFDLDADGSQNSLAMLATGSAYLALDKNGNGHIDDGRELFGAISGDGFADLARYDGDGNGFIDEGDPVYENLKLWIPDAQGKGRLLSLADAGIGALSLMRANGGFDLIAGGQLQGQVRSTGMFLFEDGRTGSMQQIDLVV